MIMQYVKNSFRVLLTCVLIGTGFSLFAQKEKPLVVSTASIFADMVSVIGDTLVESVSVVPIGGDPHIYEPTPRDVRILIQADLIIKNGLTFEGWLTDLINNSGSTAPVATITEGITPITSQAHQNATDPHAWMEPVNGKVYASNIKDALIKILPEHRDQIERQCEQYIRQLDELDQYIRQRINTIPPNKRVLITSHDSFHYYGQRYGIRLESLLGTSTDADVRTSDIMRINKVIKENKIPVVFVESTINPKMLKQVAEDNNISIGGNLYSDSLGDKDSPADTYLNMVRSNTDVIVNGLNTVVSDSDPVKSDSSTKTLMFLGIGFCLSALVFYLWRKRLFTV
jgi:ABC-type Zn uptake system ZnuABC Zn-binding protein ZnuA